MARLTDEKVDLVQELGGSAEYVERIHQEEISRQIMIGLEGSFFLALILIGTWLIYRALARTQQLKLRQENFLMAVTHELKTPLASVKLYLETLESTKVTDESKRSLIPKIGVDLRRLESLVENILEAGRIARSEIKLHQTEFDLTSVVAAALKDFSERPHPGELTVESSLEPGIHINGDPAAIRKALDAVLDNTVKYRQGDKIYVQVQLNHKGERTVLSIRDDGIGLEKHELKPIFDRFYRVGNELTRSSSGTGLGLYLAREIIKANDGDIEAHSAGLNRGTEIRIRLIATKP